MRRQPIAVSAPGKVLFAGGFLVLDRAHRGLVFGLNARIHVHIQPFRLDFPRPPEFTSSFNVCSPQFKDANWYYGVYLDADGDSVRVEQPNTKISTPGKNVFVETALRYALTYLKHLKRWDENDDLRITILADDDYYSKSQTSISDSGKMGKFTKFGCKLNEAHKTGLGSSAALTTAVIAALLMYFDRQDTIPFKQIHNLAQAAHCAAQGKVGSGFDVAAAVYGSCLYKRFTPKILEDVGDAHEPGFGERLHRCVEDLDPEQKWDVEIASQAVKISEGLLLVMCDVDCGSETPGMVKKVLQWRKDQPEEARLLWTAIQQGSNDMCTQLRKLAEPGNSTKDNYHELADIILTIRSLVREMSEKSKVPIEPPVITELLDACTALPGVVGGVAPGAGGYDAVALLVHNNEGVIRSLEEKLQGWKSKEESGAVIGNVRLLGVKQEKEGLRIESADSYNGWP